jgi:hypothetical protein
MTATATTYTATAYAQCASDSNNYAGTLNGYGIATEQETDGRFALAGVNTGDSTKEGCCNSCAANPLCGGTAFYGGYGAGGQCFIFITSDSSCSVGQYSIGSYEQTALGPDEGYLQSNGNCGFYTSNLGPY